MRKYIIGAVSVLLPSLALAQAGTIYNFSTLINRLDNVINLVIPFIVGLAVLVIIYGIFSFISSAGDEEKRATAKQFIIWGIIGVFVMLSVWGLVSILVNSFDLNGAGAQAAASGSGTVPVQPVGNTPY